MPDAYWKWFKVVQKEESKPYVHRMIEEFLPKDVEYEIKGFYQGTYLMLFIGAEGEARRLELDTNESMTKVLSWSVFDKDRNLIHKEVLHNES